MKCRKSFVSNSSSSSFILNFDEEIKSKEQLKEVLFKNAEEYQVNSYDAPTFSTDDIVNFLYRDFKSKKSKDDVLDFLVNDYDYNWPGKDDWDYSKFDKNGYNKILRVDLKNWYLKKHYWEYSNDLAKEHGRKDFKKLLEKLKHIYIVDIEDHGEMGANLEQDERMFGEFLIKCINQH